uniref:NADH-ubiquinone oxidoreductase chain 5 n=1 Tax=Podocnemis unifilis TaxID=227871 RepID=K4EJG4_PODUN|nr:NADH dehydrogenase subunit 5 [Podocnemis unifilis]
MYFSIPTPTEFFMMEMLLLTMPLLLHFTPKFLKLTWTPKTSMMWAFTLSLFSLMNFTNNEIETMTYTIYSSTSLNINLNIKLDEQALLFTSVALFITWSILEYTEWYMAEEHEHQKFSHFLLLFLMTMLIFIPANDLLLLFIGWEAMGIMSFLLISWWRGRIEATMSGLQAVIYNRTADIGLFLLFSWSILNLSTLNLDSIFSYPEMMNPLPIIGIILAATGKSAQFGFHPWLPAAMEGPTPVSALLHSSTMVTAGVYLLIRMYPILNTTPLALKSCLILGSITTLLASTRALMQNDIKKIIAFSTLSQLGLMVATIGLNQPDLAFLHICIHAFFKANMFLCAGAISHTLFGEQDIRKMTGLTKILPTTTYCMIISTLALAGFPYLAAFFSKEIIMKMAMTSNTNSFCLLMIMVSIAFTTIYSLRMSYMMLTSSPWYNHLPTFNEHPTCQKAITRLTLMSIIAGSILTPYILPTSPNALIITPSMILFMLFLTMLIAILALPLMANTLNQPLPPNTFMNYLKTMTEELDGALHRKTADKILSMGQLKALQLLDMHWKEKAGPKYIQGCMIPPILHTTSFKGLIKPYLLSFIFLLIITLLLTIK